MIKSIKRKRKFHSRSKFFACLLTFCAGFIDAYTFIERGGTLVAGQTGNVVFLSVELILFCGLTGFLPATVSNLFIVPPIGFCMGLVATAFGEVDGIVYNNSFMTGNIKKTMVAFGTYVRTKEKTCLTEGIFFVALLGSFVIGAIISTYLIQFYLLKTIWLVAIILLAFLNFRMVQYIRRR